MRSTSLLYKILPTNLGACKLTFYTIYTSHLRWNSTQCTVFIIQTSDRMQYFTILQNKLHSFNIQDDRSTRGLLAKPLKKKKKNHLYGQPVLTFAVRAVVECWTNINRVTLQHNKEFIMFIFYLMILLTCNLQKRLIRSAFWVLLQAMFTERLKTNGTAEIKITRKTTSN